MSLWEGKGALDRITRVECEQQSAAMDNGVGRGQILLEETKFPPTLELLEGQDAALEDVPEVEGMNKS